MSGLSLEFGFLLLSSIFQYSEGVKNDDLIVAGRMEEGIYVSWEGKSDECPEPDTTKFGEYYTDQYVVGTWVRYNCVEGYKRHGGRSNIIICRKVSGVSQWTYKHQPGCMAAGPSPTEKWENSSIGPQISNSTSAAVEGFCGVPVPLKHATAKVMKYKVGQKLTFKHLNESQARAPITGIITCENSCGIAVWSSLNPQCTDDIALISGKQRLNAATLFIMAAGTMVFIL